MIEPEKLDYETRQPQPQKFRLPEDWRRRLILATVASAIVFVLTLDAARRSQSTPLVHFASKAIYLSLFQQQVNDYARTSGTTPTSLTDVPVIAAQVKTSPAFVVDGWNRPFQLVNVSGRATVITYGRDGKPGGEGFDADISSATYANTIKLPMRQFVAHADLSWPLLLCTIAAVVTGIVTFAPTHGSPHKKYGLLPVLLTTLVTGVMAVVVGGFIAGLEVTTGGHQLRFGYLTDPLFVACLLAYAANRWLLKPLIPSGFAHNHLNDLICIPFWVPIMLWIQRKLRLRPDDARPRAPEIIIPLILWSWMFEVWLPSTSWGRQYCVGDPMDVVWYSIGSAVAAVLWYAQYSRSSSNTIAALRHSGAVV